MTGSATLCAVDTLCLEVTDRCPLLCIHCSADASPGGKAVFPVSVFRDLLADVAVQHEVYLSGGEPFTHPELGEFVSAASKTVRNVVVYTSGVCAHNGLAAAITDERLTAIAMAGVSRLDLSIYDSDPQRHDQVTRVAGSHKALSETVVRLRRLGIPFGFHYVPLVDGGRNLLRVAAFARESGAVRFHVLPLASQGRGAALAVSRIPTPLLTMLSLMCETPGFRLVVSSEIRRQLNWPPTQRDSWRSCFIDARGSVSRYEGCRPANRCGVRPDSVQIVQAISLLT